MFDQGNDNGALLINFREAASFARFDNAGLQQVFAQGFDVNQDDFMGYSNLQHLIECGDAAVFGVLQVQGYQFHAQGEQDKAMASLVLAAMAIHHPKRGEPAQYTAANRERLLSIASRLIQVYGHPAIQGSLAQAAQNPIEQVAVQSIYAAAAQLHEQAEGPQVDPFEGPG